MKKPNKSLSRRQFFRSTGAAVGLAGIVASGIAPIFWKQRSAYAAGPTGSLALSGGAIFFVLNGGARTQAMFNGSIGELNRGANPFGAVNNSDLRVPMSALQATTGLADPEINAKLNFVTCKHYHDQSASHNAGRTVACTGYTPAEDKAGILTRINSAFAFRDIPCINIGNDTPATNIGTEISSTYSPIKINSALSVSNIVEATAANSVTPAEAIRLAVARRTLSERFHTNSKYTQPEDVTFFQRKAEQVAAQLSGDALKIDSDAILGTYLDGTTDVENSFLRSRFGVSADGGGNTYGARAMLALRLRQLGIGGVVISSDTNFDFHSNERDQLPIAAFEVGQAIAGLVDQLSKIPDSQVPGATLLDTTVITVLTDFSRGNYDDSTGFNRNGGSDETPNEDQTRIQHIPIIGGGLPGGKVLGQIRRNGLNESGSQLYDTRQILATTLDLLGISHLNHFPDGSVSPLTQELIA